ncbi:TerB N-terminal domain-containing protein [Anaerobacillus isosaccharinicus]|uniref:TerB N-terminal domain-containing protein n=1 Tax=Anaerobacillus isosaccharinicus TaxID=1532552 RepID=A0A1S2M5N6_9BACI|nr:TerB N-terminal domain-containing protein [Anaerobacillus isosaccharinicus]MBA5586449.1 TerB N-terminal domain-containing protein [Anaerobacillus isosaccharinicus]QOY35308.1 TerB N-terminal domain-containing protein [Anaerobacillus isosaccharinicus]
MMKKSKTVGYLLAFFLGGIGGHLFYYKKYIRGLIYLIFCWTYIPIFLGWIDMLFIKKWHNQLDSTDDKKTLEEKSSQAKVFVQSKSKESKSKPKRTTSLFNKNFYNEEELILPKYLHLETPASILKNVDKVLKSQKSTNESGSVRLEFSYSHSHSDFIKKSHNYRNRTQGPTKEIPLQAYWTTFDHMNDKQLKWYFHWREEALKGNYLEVDLSYIFVFVYELLNYSFNPKASFNVSMLVRLYESYVDMHPKLSNYLPRWIQDMLNELKEEELASEWKYRDYVPPVYKAITEDHKPLNKISITHWRTYIRNYRETKFFLDNKNKIYKVFKDSLLLLEAHHNQQNEKVEDVWFTNKRVRNVAHLFSGAVIGRGNEPIHVYHTEVQPTDTLYDEITALFRLSENVTRILNGEKREIKVEEELLPADFKNELLDRYSEGAMKANERFKTVKEKDTQATGSVIPQRPLVEGKTEVAAVTTTKPTIEFNDENIERLNLENKHLQGVFEGSGNEETQLESTGSFVTATPDANTTETTPEVTELDKTIEGDTGLDSLFDATDGDEEKFMSSLSDAEKEFLSSFNNGEYSQDEATAFVKKNGKMLGLFLSELNEKANEHLGDNIVELEGDNIILYDEFTDIALMLKGA